MRPRVAGELARRICLEFKSAVGNTASKLTGYTGAGSVTDLRHPTLFRDAATTRGTV